MKDDADLPEEEEVELDKNTLDQLIEKVDDLKLREALRVVASHCDANCPNEDGNETTWGVFDYDSEDEFANHGIIIGIYRF